MEQELCSAHAAKVARIAGDLATHARGVPVSLRKRACSHQVPKRYDKKHRDDKIDIADLTEILEIDPERLTCTAEAGVTFAALVDATLRHGLAPVVVPEFRTITIGGAVSGCSLESTSFRYGGFHDTCLEYEVVTATGEVLTCTPDNEHKLVFEMLNGSFGTLGVLSKLTFRLLPALPYVHVVYERQPTLGAFKDAIARHADGARYDFMDGFIHGPTSFALCLGRFVDRAPYASRYGARPYYLTTAVRREDYLRTQDYFFRYDHGVTNVGQLSSSALLRLAERLPWLIPARRPPVTVDLFIPFSRVDGYLEWHARELGFFPLWVVPYRRTRDYAWINPRFYAGIDDRLFLDLAIYGMRQPRGRNCYKEIEAALAQVNGLKTLISYNYYDEDTFWGIFNRENHFAAKRRTDPANVFRDLYTKTCRAPHGFD